MLPDRIKMLRVKTSLTQSDLAKKLGVTRSCVNAWELGTTMPTIASAAKLAEIFDVSLDYLFDMSKTKTVSVDGLTDSEIMSVLNIIECYRKNHNEKREKT